MSGLSNIGEVLDCQRLDLASVINPITIGLNSVNSVSDSSCFGVGMEEATVSVPLLKPFDLDFWR